MPSRATNPQENQRRKRSRSPKQLLKSGSKSVRGFLTGKKKKKSDKLELNDAPNPTEADEATVYNVEIDPNGSSQSPHEKKLLSVVEEVKEKLQETPIQIVLLLMDAHSRRFELIQLSFDACSSTVSDILKQIPLSATEISLRTQAYDSVCLTDGKIMSDDVFLIAYIDQLKNSHNILLAIPSGMESLECLKLSTPILNDPKVKKMLKGVDSAEPEPAPEVKEPEEDAAPVGEEDKEEENEQTNLEPESETKLDTMEVSAKEIPEMKSTGKDYGPLLLFFILLWIMTPVVFVVHARITSPLGPGDSLPVGHYRSTCGLFSILPEEYTGCQDTVLKLTDTGFLTLTAFEGESERVLWEMEGKCPDGKECVAKFGEDGYITIGESPGKPMKGKKTLVTLTPFPFTIEPITSKRRK